MTGVEGAPQTLILSRSEIAGLMSPADYLKAVEQGFRALHEGNADLPAPWHVAGDGGGFHGKGAGLRLDRLYVALKLNGNFPDNPALGLPTVQGAILLCDGATGAPLAVMDSIEVTLRRTAAATALAARHLARPESATALMCGCGAQAPVQLEALRAVLPLTHAFVWDRDRSRADRFCSDGVELAVADDLAEAARQSDVIVTCTPSQEPFLTPAMIRPGTFIAAVGADAPHKSEIHPELMACARLVVDSLAQCLAMGDLRHAVAAGTMTTSGVHAELAEVVAGAKPGRTDQDEVTMFDSTGTALQDVASAVRIYRRAIAAGRGRTVALGE